MIEELKTDYKDDVLATSQQGKRTFNIVGKNGEILFEDVHIEDTSKYTQVGDEYGQEIINEQNSAINQLSKGTGYVFDTYAEYLEAYQGGEIPNGAIVYIKEGSVDGTITALQVKYNDSNVKLALDTLGTRVTQLNNDLLKTDSFEVTLQANPYVSPFTHFIAQDTHRNVVTATVDTGGDTSPTIACILSDTYIGLYGMHATVCTVNYTYRE